MTKLSSLLLATAVSAFAIAPSMVAQSVHTDFDHRAPFADLRTYSFGKVQTTNPLDEHRVRDEIRMDLNFHGLHELPAGSVADLRVTAVEAEHNTQEYTSFYNGLGPGFGWGGWGGWYGGGFGDQSTTVQQVPVGTLMVDLYDTHTSNLVWRGVSHQNVSDNLNKDTGRLQKAIDEMFYHYPPKMK